MRKILKRLSRICSTLIGLLFIWYFFWSSFACSYADQSWTPRMILYVKLERFFGELRGTFRFKDERLSEQVATGLEEYDLLSERPVVELPKVGNDLYLETGSSAHDNPLLSAVIITSSEKVVSAALLDSAGLAIFLRSSSENNLYVATFKKWAQDLWCSQTPVYVGLGSTYKIGQKYDPSLVMSECRPLSVQTIYLSGYGKKSVN